MAMKLLMRQDDPVALLEMDELGNIVKIVDIIDADKYPICTMRADRSNPGLRKDTNLWWQDMHVIPKERLGHEEIIEGFDVESTSQLSLLHGATAVDKYWLRDPDSDLKFVDVNPVWNNSRGCVSKASQFIGIEGFKSHSLGDIENSAAATMIGNLNQLLEWREVDDEPTLFFIKGGNPKLFYQEPINEKIMSWVCEQLGFPHAPYNYEMIDGLPYSYCPSFLSPKKQFVAAWHIIKTQKQRGSEKSIWKFYIHCCAELGVDPVTTATSMGQHFLVDSLGANTDRHGINFGLIQNLETGLLKPAPIHDNGNSLFINDKLHDGSSNHPSFITEIKQTGGIISTYHTIDNPPSKFFKDTANETLHMVLNDKLYRVDLREYLGKIKWLENNLPDYAHAELTKYYAERIKWLENNLADYEPSYSTNTELVMPTERIDAIAFGLKQRADITHGIIERESK